MKLREIKLQNFRNLVDISIPMGDTTILVGENNSGKTALMDALKIALPYYITSRQALTYGNHTHQIGAYDWLCSRVTRSLKRP